MNGLLEYILLHHFGYIVIALALLLASLVIRNKLAQLIVLFKTELTEQKTVKPTDFPDLNVLNLEHKKKEDEKLSDEEFKETFGISSELLTLVHQSPAEEPLEVKAPEQSSPTQPELASSLSQRLLKAARGDRK